MSVGEYQARALTLLAFEPLVRGTGLIADDLGGSINTLRTRKEVLGGYWSLSFTLHGRQSEIEDWVDDGLGRHIELYGPSLSIVWEGFVNRVSANIGSLSLGRGPLLDAANKIRVVYSTVDTSTDPPTMGIRDSTDWAEDATSQAKYGVIEQVKSVGGSNAAIAASIRDVALADLKDPPTDETENLARSSQPSATVECLGYFHWLGAYTVDLTTTGMQAADAKLEAVLAEEPNSLFSTDYSYIDSNANNVGAYDRDYRTGLAVVKGLVALGEHPDAGDNRWMFGFGPGRVPYFSAIPTTVEYQRRLSDPSQRLELFGTETQVYPWAADVGKWIFYTDLLVGKTPSSDFRTDPRYLFVEQATFTAPFGVTLRGSRVSRLSQLLAKKGLGGTHA